MIDTFIDFGAQTGTMEKQVRASFATLQREISSKPLRLNTNNVNRSLTQLTGQSDMFGKSLAKSSEILLSFGTAASAIYGVQRAFSALVQSSREVELAFAQIQSILQATEKNFSSFQSGIFQAANKTGQSFADAAEVANEFARQGLSLNETLVRTKDSLKLVRLAGLQTTDAVSSLTAIVNTFKKEALDSTTAVDRLSNVAAAFAVSEKDLAEAIRRTGATAADSKVGFNELSAAVTALQERTARGGAIIGNGLKSIFTRTQRTETLDLLESLGVQVREISGDTKPVIEILKELASVYQDLAPAQKASVTQATAGLFQVNNLKALLADLSSESSIYQQALEKGNATTNEATKRNEDLNVTLDALFNKTSNNAQKFASSLGSVTIEPAVRQVLSGLNSIFEKFDEFKDNDLGSILLDGIGNFVSGSGLTLITGFLLKIGVAVGKAFLPAIKDLGTLGSSAQKYKLTQDQVLTALNSQSATHQRLIQSAQTEQQFAERLLFIYRQMTKEAQSRNAALAASVRNVNTVAVGGKVKNRASGFIPKVAGAVAAEKQMIKSGVGGVSSQAKPVVIKDFNTGRGKETVVANSEEYIVKNFQGSGASAIFNPQMIKDLGGADSLRLLGQVSKAKAGGFVPNYAEGIGRTTRLRNGTGGIVKVSAESVKTASNLEEYTRALIGAKKKMVALGKSTIEHDRQLKLLNREMARRIQISMSQLPPSGAAHSFTPTPKLPTPDLQGPESTKPFKSSKSIAPPPVVSNPRVNPYGSIPPRSVSPSKLPAPSGIQTPRAPNATKNTPYFNYTKPPTQLDFSNERKKFQNFQVNTGGIAGGRIQDSFARQDEVKRKADRRENAKLRLQRIKDSKKARFSQKLGKGSIPALAASFIIPTAAAGISDEKNFTEGAQALGTAASIFALFPNQFGAIAAAVVGVGGVVKNVVEGFTELGDSAEEIREKYEQQSRSANETANAINQYNGAIQSFEDSLSSGADEKSLNKLEENINKALFNIKDTNIRSQIASTPQNSSDDAIKQRQSISQGVLRLGSSGRGQGEFKERLKIADEERSFLDSANRLFGGGGGLENFALDSEQRKGIVGSLITAIGSENIGGSNLQSQKNSNLAVKQLGGDALNPTDFLNKLGLSDAALQMDLFSNALGVSAEELVRSLAVEIEAIGLAKRINKEEREYEKRIVLAKDTIKSFAKNTETASENIIRSSERAFASRVTEVTANQNSGRNTVADAFTDFNLGKAEAITKAFNSNLRAINSSGFELAAAGLEGKTSIDQDKSIIDLTSKLFKNTTGSSPDILDVVNTLKEQNKLESLNSSDLQNTMVQNSEVTKTSIKDLEVKLSASLDKIRFADLAGILGGISNNSEGNKFSAKGELSSARLAARQFSSKKGIQPKEEKETERQAIVSRLARASINSLKEDLDNGFKKAEVNKEVQSILEKATNELADKTDKIDQDKIIKRAKESLEALIPKDLIKKQTRLLNDDITLGFSENLNRLIGESNVDTSNVRGLDDLQNSLSNGGKLDNNSGLITQVLESLKSKQGGENLAAEITESVKFFATRSNTVNNDSGDDGLADVAQSQVEAIFGFNEAVKSLTANALNSERNALLKNIETNTSKLEGFISNTDELKSSIDKTVAAVKEGYEQERKYRDNQRKSKLDDTIKGLDREIKQNKDFQNRNTIVVNSGTKRQNISIDGTGSGTEEYISVSKEAKKAKEEIKKLKEEEALLIKQREDAQSKRDLLGGSPTNKGVKTAINSPTPSPLPFADPISVINPQVKSFASIESGPIDIQKQRLSQIEELDIFIKNITSKIDTAGLEGLTFKDPANRESVESSLSKLKNIKNLNIDRHNGIVNSYNKEFSKRSLPTLGLPDLSIGEISPPVNNFGPSLSLADLEDKRISGKGIGPVSDGAKLRKDAYDRLNLDANSALDRRKTGSSQSDEELAKKGIYNTPRVSSQDVKDLEKAAEKQKQLRESYAKRGESAATQNAQDSNITVDAGNALDVNVSVKSEGAGNSSNEEQVKEIVQSEMEIAKRQIGERIQRDFDNFARINKIQSSSSAPYNSSSVKPIRSR